MNKLLPIAFLLFLVFIPPVYGDAFKLPRPESLMDFADSYTQTYYEIIVNSNANGNLPDSFRDYKIDNMYVFYIYQESPFYVRITVFNNGIVLNYIPKQYRVSNKNIDIFYSLNDSYQNMMNSHSAYVRNMISTWYGYKFKLSEFGETKLVETSIILPNNTINTNPSEFASKIAQDDFKYDLSIIMKDKLDRVCDPYRNSLYSEIGSVCYSISENIDNYSSSYSSGGVNEFENRLQALNQTTQPIAPVSFNSNLNEPKTKWDEIKDFFKPLIEVQEIAQTIIFWGLLVFAIITFILLKKRELIWDFFKKY